MNEHPQIPPNCQYFKKSSVLEGKFFEFVSDGGGLFSIPLNIKSSSWRPLIASVARCAWLDEVERLEKELEAMCQRNISRYEVFNRSPDIESTGDLRVAMETAESNAKAWKEWSVSK